MAYKLTADDHSRLTAAKGEHISTAGICTAEGHEGIPRHCSFAPHEGKLVDYKYHPETNELHSITLQGDDGVHVVCLNIKNTGSVWNIQQMVFLGKEKREKILDIKAD